MVAEAIDPSRQCPQCWQHKPLTDFRGTRKPLVTWCIACRKNKDGAAGWRRRDTRRTLRTDGEVRVLFAPASGNRKTGRIPVSTSSPETCPPSCAFYGNGCYAEYHFERTHWARVADVGVDWATFCEQVSELPAGQLWRHNVAGDLPGVGDRIDAVKLSRLVEANRGRKGFTFTHKPLTASNVRLIRAANRSGFVVNLSADDLRQADRLASRAIAPVVVVLASTTPDDGTITPAGRRVVVCPAETRQRTCATCGLCAQPERAIVGFRAHGQLRRHVDELVTLRRAR